MGPEASRCEGPPDPAGGVSAVQVAVLEQAARAEGGPKKGGGGGVEMTAWNATTAYDTKNYAHLKTTREFAKLVRKGDSVLDVGCASGGFCPEVLKRGAEYTGLDITPELLSRARKRFPGIFFIEGDIHKLPFFDNSFDVVVSWDVVVHVDKYTQAVNELYRVASRNVIFTCQMWDGDEDIFGEQEGVPYNIFSKNNFIEHLENLAPNVRIVAEYGYALPNVSVPDKCRINLNSIVTLDKTRRSPTVVRIKKKHATLLKSRFHQLWLKIRGEI
jgi:SAM-dependent methyltransferase